MALSLAETPDFDSHAPEPQHPALRPVGAATAREMSLGSCDTSSALLVATSTRPTGGQTWSSSSLRALRMSRRRRLLACCSAPGAGPLRRPQPRTPWRVGAVTARLASSSTPGATFSSVTEPSWKAGAPCAPGSTATATNAPTCAGLGSCTQPARAPAPLLHTTPRWQPELRHELQLCQPRPRCGATRAPVTYPRWRAAPSHSSAPGAGSARPGATTGSPAGATRISRASWRRGGSRCLRSTARCCASSCRTGRTRTRPAYGGTASAASTSGSLLPRTAPRHASAPPPSARPAADSPPSGAPRLV